MRKNKVAIRVDSDLLAALDELIAKRKFPNRSQAIEFAIAEKLKRFGRNRLAKECAKLDPSEERQLADQSLADTLRERPEY